MGGTEQFRHTDDLGQGRVLYQSDDLVARGGQNPLHHLGKHNAEKGLHSGEPQHLARLVLTHRDGLNAATIDFRKIGHIIDRHGHNGSSETIIGHLEQVIGSKVHENKLENQRGSPHHQQEYLCRPRNERIF